jgi:hypothetical protein
LILNYYGVDRPSPVTFATKRNADAERGPGP